MNIKTSSTQERLKRIFTHNLREKAIAAVCAAVVLLLSFCFRPVTKVCSVKVNMKISPEQELVSGAIDRVEVKVSGNFFELRKVGSENPVINFDFSAENAGEISKTIDESLLPQSFAALDIKNIMPQTLTVRTEARKVESEPETPAPEEDAAKEPADQEPVETIHETSAQQEQPAAAVKNASENAEQPANGEKNE